MNMQNMSEHEKEALKFLECDFNQSFQQIRHYDSQIFDILKFTFTGYDQSIYTHGFHKYPAKFFPELPG